MRELIVPSGDLGEIGAAVLAKSGRFRFRARGHSMVPSICDGDILVVEPVDVEHLKTGEIILCLTQPSRLVAHRVVARHAGPNGSVLVIRGDASNGPGETIEGGCVLGRVAANKRQSWLKKIVRRLAWSPRVQRFLRPL